MIEEIRNLLYQNIDEKYKDFNKSLVPGETAPMLGVRLPVLRETAKKIAKENGRDYLQALRIEETKSQVYHEELMLHGIIIGYLTCDIEERTALLDAFVPMIDNWSVCDSSCMTYKFMKQDMQYWFGYLSKYAKKQNEYEIRFAVVSMLDHFVTEEYIEQVLEVMRTIRHDGYYVKMAVAWAVSVCYVKFPEQTWKLFTEDALDDFTHNKSIQKIRESYRVSSEDKEMLNKLKRPKK